MSHIVTIKDEGMDAQLVQPVIDEVSNGTLSRAREPREPNNTTTVAIEGLTLFPGDVINNGTSGGTGAGTAPLERPRDPRGRSRGIRGP